MPIELITSKDNDGQRLDRYLKNHSNMNYIQIQKFLRTGRIRLNGKRAQADTPLKHGDKITMPFFTQKLEKTATPLPRVVPKNFLLAETDDYLVINKPAGLATQGGTDTKIHVDLLLEDYAQNGVRPRLLHRLDKETSGLLLVARNRKAAIQAGDAFQTKKIEKYYLAICHGYLKKNKGIIDFNIIKSQGRMQIADSELDNETGDNALTHYQILARAQEFSLVLLMPITGRTHQLRVHMQALGAPIIGDRKYHGKNYKNLLLHAFHLRWQTKNLEFTSTLPDIFHQALREFGLEIASKERLNLPANLSPDLLINLLASKS